MKKTLKIFATVLVIALAICSFAFIASAEAVKPEIVSSNISYEGDYALLLAIDAATVSGNSVSVKVWDNTGKELGSFSDSTAEKIDALDASKEYYVIKTPGIAQKDMDKEYTYQATDAAGNAGDVKKLSVAEYFYTRLFVNGIADATEGADAVRRDFYIDTLEHGAKAQNLLYNYNDKTDDDISVFVTDLLYANIPGFDKVLLDNNTTTVTLGGEGSYTVRKYAKDTLVKTVAAAQAGDVITIDAHTVVVAGEVEAPFAFGNGKYYSDIIYGGQRFDYSSLGANGNFKYDGANVNKVEAVDGKMVYSKTGTGEDYIRWNYDAKPANINKFVFETDFMFDNFTATSITAQKILFQANGINHQVTPGLSSVDDFATERETFTIGQLELAAGKWYNICLEFDYTAGVITYYLNGVNVGTEAISAVTTGNTRILWYYQTQQTTGSMSFDNTFVGWVETPVEAADFVAGTGVYYTGGSLTKYDGSSTSGIASSNWDTNQAVSFSNATEGTNSVLKATIDADNGAGQQAYLQFNTTMTDAATEKYVFESDFKFENFDTTTANLGFLRFRFVNKYVEVKVNTVNAENVRKIAIGKMALTAGEWYNIRFEVDMSTGVVTYFVNGTNVGSETLTLNSSTSAQNRFLWYSNTGVSVDMYFDNFCYGVVTK